MKTIVTDVELLPLKEGSSEQWWMTKVNVEYTDSQGEKEQSLLPYVLKMKVDDGSWKVDDLSLNARVWNPFVLVATLAFVMIMTVLMGNSNFSATS